MAAFTKKKMSCIGCKVPLKVETDAVCEHCRAKEGEIYQKEIASVATLEERFNQLWTQCQRCQVDYWGGMDLLHLLYQQRWQRNRHWSPSLSLSL